MNFLLISLIASSSSIAAQHRTVDCSMAGKNGGQPAYAKANLSFDISEDRDGLRTISDLRGEMRATNNSRELESNDAYIGQFEIKRVAENPNYRPVKYKDSSQFRDINAAKTIGAESGMWGSLIVPKRLQGVFEIHYIFQAGDHMGGTIHMSCRVRN